MTDRNNKMNMKSVFDIVVIRDTTRKGPHYPSYKVTERKIATATTVESAERLIRDHVILCCEYYYMMPSIHSFRVEERPLDTLTNGCYSIRIYDKEGVKIDETMCSSIIDDKQSYPGRTPEQIRFKPGDIVEFLYKDEINLGFVVSCPPTVELTMRIKAKGFDMDDTDDAYTIMTTSDYASHRHIYSVFVFKPQFKIQHAVENRLREAYNMFLCSD